MIRKVLIDMDKNAEKIIRKINELRVKNERLLIAIDGKCASGKTTLAEHIGQQIDCNIFHTDDYFLRPEQRTKDRLNEPGGNIDRERFSLEIIIPVLQGKDFYYYPYNCRKGALDDPIRSECKPINIIEGAYSCHPAMREYYDLRIFLSVSADKQLERLRKRENAESLEKFISKWIPLEERYFSSLNIPGHCDMNIVT